MPAAYPPIADYGLISDLYSCALVSRAGSVDWCCFPRFDSPAVFARLLDWQRGGYWLLAPSEVTATERRYLPRTNVLETTFETAEGEAVLLDFMPVQSHTQPSDPHAVDAPRQIVRMLRCTRGSVSVRMRCEPRFDYGGIIPHAVLLSPRSGFVHGGEQALAVFCSAPMREADGGFDAEATLSVGEELTATVTYAPLFHHDPGDVDPAHSRARLQETTRFWEEWSALCRYQGQYATTVLRSALTLKALTYARSGGIVAAATTSLPEALGGGRNWDYRYSWIRDTSFAVQALSMIGFTEEAHSFTSWIEWSSAGRAPDLQAVYGVIGERRLDEIELPHLEGYRQSSPVRVGNRAYRQYQADAYGQLLDAAYLHRKIGGDVAPDYWRFLTEVVEFVIAHWREPDEGIWEVRSGRRQFVYSKVWCWVALDRALRVGRGWELPGDYAHWERVREEIRQDVLRNGFNPSRGTFVQEYGGERLDAALLMLPLVGFIKATDPRMRATIEAIERELTTPEGLVYRYLDMDDGLEGGESPFTMCGFWLVSNLLLLGEEDRARVLFEHLLSHANDLGLLSEEMGAATGEMLGNFPQAFSHMGLINAAVRLDAAARRRQHTGA